MISRIDGPRLLQIGARVTFPVISRSVKPQGQAPYSRHGPLSSGRLKPDVVLPGDGITSTSVGAACSFKQMSLSKKMVKSHLRTAPHSTFHVDNGLNVVIRDEKLRWWEPDWCRIFSSTNNIQKGLWPMFLTRPAKKHDPFGDVHFIIKITRKMVLG